MSDIEFNLEKTTFSIENIQKNILPKFNIFNSTVSLVKFKNTNKQRAVYKVNCNSKDYCLKKVYFSEEELLYVYSALEWLYRNNINVPKFLPSYNNGRFIKYNDMLFILTTWIDGEKCNFDIHRHVISSSLELAKLHNISEHFTPIDGSFIRKGFDNLYESTSRRVTQILQMLTTASKNKNKFSMNFIDCFSNNLELCKLSLQYSYNINYDNLSTSLCHGDYVNKNIIFSKNNDLWIIDFDKCKNDYCAHDISYFLRRLLKRDNTNWNIDIAMSVLSAYNSRKKLSKDDLKYITSYLCFPQKYWKTSRDYYKNINNCNETYYLSLIKKINSKTSSQLNFCNTLIDIFTKNNWTIS